MAGRLAEVGVEILVLAHKAANQCEEMIREFRVELPAAKARDEVEGFIDRTGRRIGPTVGHGVEDVGQGDDSGASRDVLALELLRVAGAVPPFVVAAGDFLGDAELGDLAAGQNLSTYTRMNFDELHFSFTKRLLVQKNFFGNANFSNVMKPGGNI